MPSSIIKAIFLFLTLCVVGCSGNYRLNKANHVGHTPIFTEEEIDEDLDYRMGNPPKLDLVLTKEVEYSINYFLTKDPNYLAIAAKNRAKYEPRLSKIFRQHNLPVELLHAATIESMYKNKSRSSYGAVGIWQFVSGTARHCGLKVNFFTDERKDPYLSTEAAACYLIELQEQFKDWRWTLAAYNYGPGRLHKLRRKYPQLDFWEIARLPEFPSRTKAYVSRIYAAAILDRQDVPPRYYTQGESATILAWIRTLYRFT